jgi:hypothetical protein
MKSIRVLLLSFLTLALLGVCLSAGPANAQGFTGKFTLPFEARWGLATLPAGEYSFSLEAKPGGLLKVVRGTRTVALVYAHGWDQKSSARNALMVVKEGGASIVREVTLRDIALVLYYAPHKVPRGSAQEERQVAQVIPISAAGAGQ